MRMLDLFCGEGLLSWGYWLSGRFSEIVGVDISDHSKAYAFDFVQADALSLDYEFLMSFDFIHASPPCQAYSKATPDKTYHPKLIIPTLQMLAAAGLPYVVENVEGSGKELRPNLRLSGRDVGLPIARPRYFNISSGPATHISTRQMSKIIGDHKINLAPGANVRVHNRVDYVSRGDIISAFGLECIPNSRLKNITRDGMLQGVPPAFSLAIARAIFPQRFMIV